MWFSGASSMRIAKTTFGYYVIFADGKYARIDFTMTAGGEHFFTINSYLNPSGSRHLEYDPKKRVSQK